MLPSKSTSPDVLDTLATVFHGPASREHTFPPRPSEPEISALQEHAECKAARALYFLYLNYNTRLFEDLVKHADTVALEPHALAAINVITSIATANWLPLAKDTIPTDDDFLSWLPYPPTATPDSGPTALLAPPSLEHTLPYLLKPPQTFSNIVGGFGDTQNSAYKIATAKFDALRALHDRLKDHLIDEPEQGYGEIVETLRKRIVEGPWGRQGQIGTNIATMEL